MLGYVFEVYFCINVERRLCLLGRNMLFYIMLEPVSELSYLIPSQGESGSIGMTAEIEQEVAAALDGRVDVKARNAACRTGSHVAIPCKNHGRAEVDFGESGSYDADDSLFPSFIIEHDAGVVFHAFQTRNDAVGFFSHLLVYVFALLIILIDVSGHAQG